MGLDNVIMKTTRDNEINDNSGVFFVFTVCVGNVNFKSSFLL